MDVTPPSVSPSALRLHNFPRFGFSNRLANLASDDDQDRADYVNGIIAFLISLAMIAFLWIIVLFVLKFTFGKERVGCAAGGEPVDVSALRRAKVSRADRRHRIVRIWRTQAVFIFGCMLMPALSFLFVNHGLTPFYHSMSVMVDIASVVEQRAYEGMDTASSILIRRSQIQRVKTSINLTQCVNDVMQGGVETFNQSLNAGMEQISGFVDGYIPDVMKGLAQVTDSTDYVESTLSSADVYDWVVKGILIGLNIVVVMLLLAAFLARNSINSPLYQDIVSHFLVPTFCVLMTAFVMGTCITAAMAMVNADFCTGGDEKSPTATLDEILQEKDFTRDDISYQAFQYYAQDCYGVNPFSFVHNMGVQVSGYSDMLGNAYTAIDVFSASDLVAAECADDMNSLADALTVLDGHLRGLAKDIEGASNMTSCASIQPIVRRLLRGVPCSESVDGMSWLFGTTLGITVVGLIMLSTRAAMYSPVLKPRRVKRREREFREYKEYMAEFYDVGDWKLEPPKKMLESVETFDTEDTEETNKISPTDTDIYWDETAEVSLGDDKEHSTPEATPTKPQSPPPPASARTAKIVAAARAMAREGVSRFQDRDPEVEYYSSDSEDEASNDDKSHLTGFVSRFLPQTSVQDPNAPPKRRRLESLDNWKELVTPAFLTPRKNRRPGIKNASPSNEMEPLTPSPTQDKPKAPRKRRKALGRTQGGSRMHDRSADSHDM